MIKIQKLKEPKKTSGQKLEFGHSCHIGGLVIRNNNEFPVYVNLYRRKKPIPTKKPGKRKK